MAIAHLDGAAPRSSCHMVHMQVPWQCNSCARQANSMYIRDPQQQLPSPARALDGHWHSSPVTAARQMSSATIHKSERATLNWTFPSRTTVLNSTKASSSSLIASAGGADSGVNPLEAGLRSLSGKEDACCPGHDTSASTTEAATMMQVTCSHCANSTAAGFSDSTHIES